MNVVCLNLGRKAPIRIRGITDPAQCTGALAPNNGQGGVSAFIPLLGCYDLTRTAARASFDGCPAGLTTSGLFSYNGHTDIKGSRITLFAEDLISG